MFNIVFKDTWILSLIPLVGGFIYVYRHKLKKPALLFSSNDLLASFQSTWRLQAAENLIYLRILIIILFLVALAGPRKPLDKTYTQTEGVDIVLAIDSSGSMLAEDFRIGVHRKNRLEVVKEVAQEFISNRASDRIGLVTFAALAYTACPLTLDHDWLSENLQRIEIGAIQDGTAIGSAISSSLNRLKDTEAKSKIIILLTDGINNSGKISPQIAAQAAAALGVKVYTIGVGTKEAVPYPARDLFGRKVYQRVEFKIDEEALQAIADKTRAKYYRATDTESLKAIYAEIDALEKTEIKEAGFRSYKELFFIPLLIALLFLLGEVVLSETVLRTIP